jgi:hypothetical protein
VSNAALLLQSFVPFATNALGKETKLTPLFEAIERLTNPYAMQERVYRNRVDAPAHLDDLLITRADDTRRMATLEARYGVTWFPLDR